MNGKFDKTVKVLIDVSWRVGSRCYFRRRWLNYYLISVFSQTVTYGTSGEVLAGDQGSFVNFLIKLCGYVQ